MIPYLGIMLVGQQHMVDRSLSLFTARSPNLLHLYLFFLIAKYNSGSIPVATTGRLLVVFSYLLVLLFSTGLGRVCLAQLYRFLLDDYNRFCWL